MKTELNKYNVIWFKPPPLVYPSNLHPKIPLANLHVDKVVTPFIEELRKIVREHNVVNNAVYNMNKEIIEMMNIHYEEKNYHKSINSIMLNYKQNKQKYFL